MDIRKLTNIFHWGPSDYFVLLLLLCINIFQFRSNIHVQHVDVKEGQTEVILRFDTAVNASQVTSIFFLAYL